MARPKKRTVDYFPHYCQHKKTMFILEQRYGNDGYAFWFKLLEMLGSYDDHYIDLNNAADWEFLQAKTRLSEDICSSILDLLAKLDAIDPELWEQKVVWSQNFVDGLAPLYANRRVETPQRPSFYIQKPQPADVSTEINTQSRVEESRVKESRVEEGPKTPPPPQNATQEEREILSILKNIDKYPLDYPKDIELIRQLAVEFVDIDLREEARRFAIYKMDRPLKAKSNPRLQLRNWFAKAKEFEAERRQKNGANRGHTARGDPAGRYREFVRD